MTKKTIECKERERERERENIQNGGIGNARDKKRIRNICEKWKRRKVTREEYLERKGELKNFHRLSKFP